MPSINKAIIVGHLGRDPEARHMPSGDTVCNFSIATSDTWKDKETGEKKEATEWHRISAFGKLADICQQYLRKGSLVYIEGSLRTRKWQDKDGSDRYTTEIRANEMKMLGGKPADSDQAPEPKPARRPQSAAPIEDLTDDIPF